MMVNVLYKYSIQKSSTPAANGSTMWVIGKIDEDGNPVQTYTVTETTYESRNDYVCSCPSYKPLCKHVHWVKGLKMLINREPTRTGGIFNPATNDWEPYGNEEEDV